MRPVRRGGSPQPTDFEPYTKALQPLATQIGLYCSYCERHLSHGAEVEHIQPKSLPAYASLIGRWSNFLLGCKNCNATKSNKDVVLSNHLLPDRDNTFLAFDYLQDGHIEVSTQCQDSGLSQAASDTLALTGLNKKPSLLMNDAGNSVALDRYRQRMEIWLAALLEKEKLELEPDSKGLRSTIAYAASQSGFFSIWMKVFENDTDMRLRLIKAFPGTAESGCFDSDGLAMSPHPNDDRLAGGGKI